MKGLIHRRVASWLGRHSKGIAFILLIAAALAPFLRCWCGTVSHKTAYVFPSAATRELPSSVLTLISESGNRRVDITGAANGKDLQFALPNLPDGNYSVFLTIVGVVSKEMGAIEYHQGKPTKPLTAISPDDLLRRSPLTPRILVDAAQLSDSQSAALMGSLNDNLPKDKWRHYTVKRGESVYSIIKHLYGYRSSRYRKTARTLEKAIVTENHTSKLQIGTTIRVPPLPQKPDPKVSTRDRVQELRLPSGELQVFKFTDLGTELSPVPNATPKSAQLWSVTGLTGTTAATIQSDIARRQRPQRGRCDNCFEGHTRRSVYVDYDTSFVDVFFTDIPSGPPVSPLELKPLLAPHDFRLPSDVVPNGDLYIIDNFTSIDGKSCSHGDMVFSVASETLESLGAPDSFRSHIHKIELDFFSNPEAEAIVRAYAHSFTQSGESKALADLARLKKLGKKKSAGLPVPALYLAALMDYYSRKPVALVSTSFVTFTEGMKWLPDDYGETSSTVFIGAVLDNEKSVVESDLYAHDEPFQSYLKSPQLGVILVGGETAPGMPFGMTSKQAKVTCVGFAAGWNHGSGCFSSPGAVGTSFATPHIAALLLMAESYWKSHGLAINAVEAKTRLLLSSDVIPSFLALYASAGVPRIDRLLQGRGCLLIDQNDQVSIVKLAESKLKVETSDGELTASLGRGLLGISGLQIVDGKVLVFRETKMRWEEVRLFELSLTIQGKASRVSMEEFTKKYKGAITL